MSRRRLDVSSGRRRVPPVPRPWPVASPPPPHGLYPAPSCLDAERRQAPAVLAGRPIPSDIRRAILAALRERFRKRVRTANPALFTACTARDSRLIACAHNPESVG